MSLGDVVGARERAGHHEQIDQAKSLVDEADEATDLHADVEAFENRVGGSLDERR